MKGLGIGIGGLFFFLRKEGGRGVMWKGIGKKCEVKSKFVEGFNVVSKNDVVGGFMRLEWERSIMKIWEWKIFWICVVKII